jgi:chromosomal replication initiator protein
MVKKRENRIENLTFARYVPMPENRSALLAVRDVANRLGTGVSQRAISPLYLHGPAGTGKTHLIAALIDEVIRQSPQLIITLLQAGDLGRMARSVESSGSMADTLQAAKQSDLLIVEDLQHLIARPDDRGSAVTEVLVQIFDHLHTRQRQLIFTATVGPRELAYLPARLLSRLQSGLVVGLRPMQLTSRLALLQDKAQRRQLAVSPEVLRWVAEHCGGSGRQLDGALVQLQSLAGLHDRPLDVSIVADHFRASLQANQLTVERIAQRVGNYFRVDPRHLQSRRRHQDVVVPRQIGMYLARQLTDLSLGEIGGYFGGRDHSTVFHACRKIKNALKHDAGLSGAVDQLQAELA